MLHMWIRTIFGWYTMEARENIILDSDEKNKIKFYNQMIINRKKNSNK